MDRTAAIAQLPETYAAALRLHDNHLDHEQIAAQLDITIEAVEPLLRLASAKLDHILEADDQTA
jgi:DNA-directed RNA polymerase specialized sigma24 family protein